MEVLAILVSDVHLSSKPPACRSEEPDWFEAMTRPLREIRDLQEDHDCHVIYAGDIFDRWNSSCELVNFAFKHLPSGFAIPGQHDLPNHSYEEMDRSSYLTLCHAGILWNLIPEAEGWSRSGHVLEDRDGTLVGYMHGFPWGYFPDPIDEETAGDTDDFPVNIAVIHSLIWDDKTGYPGAPEDGKVPRARKRLKGWDIAHFGDNHKTVHRESDSQIIYNPGTLMRRKTSEIDHHPQVGLLTEDKTVVPYYLDTSKDIISRSPAVLEREEKEYDARKFLESLQSLGQDSLDFRDIVKRYLIDNGVSPETREIVLESIGDDVES